MLSAHSAQTWSRTGDESMNATKPLVFLAAALLSSAAFAEGAEEGMKSSDQKFQQMDKNQDSQLSKTEVSNDESLAAVFESVDADSDGYISETEYAEYASTHGESDWRQRSQSEQSESTDPY